jgi:hypothetical protein
MISCASGWALLPERKMEDGRVICCRRFARRELAVVDEILRSQQCGEVILTEGPAAAMNRFNRKEEQ